MEEKKNSLFRKKAVDRVSSPEELDRYLQVTSPGIWITLIAIIILLAGVVVWGVLGHLSTELQVAVSVEDNYALCYIPQRYEKSVKSGMKVMIAGNEYRIENIGMSEVMLLGEEDVPKMLAGNLVEGSIVCPMSVADADLAPAVYTGSIVIETISPISLVFN